MLPPSTPEDGDIVVRQEQREGSLVYVLHTAPGPDQYLLGTREEAVAQALTLAKRHHVRAWLTTDETYDFVLLENGEGPLQRMLERLRAEYLEMPGLRLKLDQVQRLCGVERTLCKTVLDALVEARFLCVKSDGAYTRLTDGEVSRPRPAKADLGVEKRVVAAS